MCLQVAANACSSVMLASTPWCLQRAPPQEHVSYSIHRHSGVCLVPSSPSTCHRQLRLGFTTATPSEARAASPASAEVKSANALRRGRAPPGASPKWRAAPGPRRTMCTRRHKPLRRRVAEVLWRVRACAASSVRSSGSSSSQPTGVTAQPHHVSARADRARSPENMPTNVAWGSRCRGPPTGVKVFHRLPVWLVGEWRPPHALPGFAWAAQTSAWRRRVTTINQRAHARSRTARTHARSASGIALRRRCGICLTTRNVSEAVHIAAVATHTSCGFAMFCDGERGRQARVTAQAKGMKERRPNQFTHSVMSYRVGAATALGRTDVLQRAFLVLALLAVTLCARCLSPWRGASLSPGGGGVTSHMASRCAAVLRITSPHRSVPLRKRSTHTARSVSSRVCGSRAALCGIRWERSSARR